jgi:hypothetical protein
MVFLFLAKSFRKQLGKIAEIHRSQKVKEVEKK